jgi:hypothetical protein
VRSVSIPFSVKWLKSSLESTIEDLIAERDKVVAHWRAQATHQGEYMGIPPTGNRVNFRACFAELKVEVLLYALGHEKDLRYRPFGRRMG